MANWNSLKITDVIEKIDREELILPVVQRDFVWSTEKIELLFDTIFKGDSFGGIMTIKDLKGKKSIFSFRKFIQDYQQGIKFTSKEPQNLTQNISYVVDGQQRLSAFYIGITGTYNNKQLYFDLLSEISYKNFNLKFSTNESDLKSNIDNFDGTKKISTFWYKLPNLYRKIEDCGGNYHTVFDEIIDEIDREKYSEEQTEIIKRNIENITNQLFNFSNVGICEVRIDRKQNAIANRQRVVELFRRLNQGGTKLDGLELMASKLKGFDAKNEIFLNEINIFEDIGFGKDEVIKLVFILQDEYNKSLVNINKTDSDFILRHDKRIKKALEGTRLFLKQSNLYDFFTTNRPSIIPLYFIAYYLFHLENDANSISEYFKNSETTNKNFLLIYEWVFLSMLNRVFRRRGAGWTAYSTGIRKISIIMSSYKNKTFPTSELFDMYDDHSLDFSTDIKTEWLGDYDFDFLMFILYGKPKNFRKNDIDHIHPKSILNKKGIDLIKINNVGNYQLIDYSSNRSKNDKELHVWIDTLTNKNLYLETHFIPKDKKLWHSKRYRSFLKERKNLIVEKLKKEIQSVQ